MAHQRQPGRRRLLRARRVVLREEDILPHIRRDLDAVGGKHRRGGAGRRMVGAESRVGVRGEGEPAGLRPRPSGGMVRAGRGVRRRGQGLRGDGEGLVRKGGEHRLEQHLRRRDKRCARPGADSAGLHRGGRCRQDRGMPGSAVPKASEAAREGELPPWREGRLLDIRLRDQHRRIGRAQPPGAGPRLPP